MKTKTNVCAGTDIDKDGNGTIDFPEFLTLGFGQVEDENAQ